MPLLEERRQAIPDAAPVKQNVPPEVLEELRKNNSFFLNSGSVTDRRMSSCRLSWVYLKNRDNGSMVKARGLSVSENCANRQPLLIYCFYFRYYDLLYLDHFRITGPSAVYVFIISILCISSCQDAVLSLPVYIFKYISNGFIIL